MNTVWVLLDTRYGEEGDFVMGVFTTPELAAAALEEDLDRHQRRAARPLNEDVYRARLRGERRIDEWPVDQLSQAWWELASRRV